MPLNYPVGEIVEDGRSLAQLSFPSFLEQWLQSSFSGYVVVTIEGAKGMEEGIWFVREGVGVGAAFSFDFLDVLVFGDSALDAFFNALAAKKGVLDVCRLSKQQVDLVLALDERVGLKVIVTKENVAKRMVSTYDASLAESASRGLQQVISPSHDLLKKIGLGEMIK